MSTPFTIGFRYNNKTVLINGIYDGGINKAGANFLAAAKYDHLSNHERPALMGYLERVAASGLHLGHFGPAGRGDARSPYGTIADGQPGGCTYSGTEPIAMYFSAFPNAQNVYIADYDNDRVWVMGDAGVPQIIELDQLASFGAFELEDTVRAGTDYSGIRQEYAEDVTKDALEAFVSYGNLLRSKSPTYDRANQFYDLARSAHNNPVTDEIWDIDRTPANRPTQGTFAFGL